MSDPALPSPLLEGSAYPTVTDQMHALIAYWEATADPRCIFLDCYCRMTGNMLVAVEGERFHDCQWVHRLLHQFADYYFMALSAYEDTEAHSPAVWQLTHDTARRSDVSAIQHLLLGVNAHINYDLALALRDLLAPEWQALTPAKRRQRYEDHLLVNKVIAETIDVVQEEVLEAHEPALDLLDKLLGPLDEWATAHIIAGWRDDVWETTLLLLAAENQREAERVRAELEKRALRRARRLLPS